MSIADILGSIGKGAATAGRAVGAVLPPVLERTAQVVSGEAPQIDEEERQQKIKLEDAALNAKADELEQQLQMGRKYGTLTPQQQQQYVDQISGLFSHPRHMNTLMARLQRAIHPGGATYQPNVAAALPPAAPAGGTAAADLANQEKLAEARIASKPLPKDAAFLQSYAQSLGKTWNELTPDEMVEAFNKEGETKSAQEKEEHQKALDDYRNSTVQLRKSEQALHEAQFKASQDPNNPKFKMDLEKARTQSMRDEAYWVNAQARAFGEVNGKPLPGAILTASGQPVGEAFAANVRPTSTETGRADLAASAISQLQTMKDILKKRPDIFGPAAGRVMRIQQFLGSQDPDAQAFLAAATTASGHLAGVFGARGKYSQEDIKKIIGNLETNPDAAIAGINQMEEAARMIQQRGTREVVGGVPQNPGSILPKAGAQPVTPPKPKVGAVLPKDDLAQRLDRALAGQTQ